MRSCVLDGSETWLVKKENEMALQLAELKMISWMCDRFICSELRERLETDDLITTVQ